MRTAGPADPPLRDCAVLPLRPRRTRCPCSPTSCTPSGPEPSRSSTSPRRCRRRRRSCSCPSRSATPSVSAGEISRYDDRGPAWYWNDITHRRAHRHPLRRADPLGHRPRRQDVSQVPPRPADRARRGARPLGARRPRPGLPARDRPRHRRGSGSTARCPRAAGCSTAPAGTPAPTTRRTSSTPTRPARTPPASPSSAPAGWPSETPILGLGVGDRRHRRGRRPLASTRPSPATRSCSARASTA